MTIRLLDQSDSIENLTDLLHSAYAQHAAESRRFFASYQSVEDTRKRISHGECWLAVHNGGIVGTVTLRARHSPPEGYPGPTVAGTFSQLAVLPAHRGTGCGRLLLDFAGRRLTELGATDVVIDTSSRATQLITWYQRNRYQIVGKWQWDVTNYQSVVLHKQL